MHRLHPRYSSAIYKAIQLDPISRERTGQQHILASATRHDAVDALLTLLGAARAAARIDPTRTLIEVDAQLWTLVAMAAPSTPDSPSLRRAGAKHKHVR